MVGLDTKQSQHNRLVITVAFVLRDKTKKVMTTAKFYPSSSSHPFPSYLPCQQWYARILPWPGSFLCVHAKLET